MPSQRSSIAWRIVMIVGLMIITASFVSLYLSFVNNSIRLTNLDHDLRMSSRLVVAEESFEQSQKKMMEIADTYIQAIESDHILDGMVTHRLIKGDYVGICDSLLFSAIYYVSLRKLGYDELAERRWNALRESQISGRWYRHPRCLTPPPSRDMIIGLLMALSQKPKDFKEELMGLLGQIDESGGFFGEGSIFVSYLLPGVAENIRRLARSLDIPHRELPAAVREGFSTIEWSVAWTKRGYRSHLHGLNLWLEEELSRNLPTGISERSVVSSVSPFTRFATLEPVDRQRMNYVSQELYEKDPQNLFFQILRYRTADAWNQVIKLRLMTVLLEMKSFPHDRLPNNCDRKADYLWQRSSREYEPESRYCTEVFNGIDYLWVAALLHEQW